MELAFVDFETRSPADLTLIGAYAYARHPDTEITVLGYAIGQEHPKVWSPHWCWENSSSCDLADIVHFVGQGGYLVAWNANFDRQIWNEVFAVKYGVPKVPAHRWLCAQAQAEANNLPGKLEKACEALGTTFKKDPHGKKLIQQLAFGTRQDWTRAHERAADGKVSRMGHFRAYCLHDITSMREVWNTTRPLTLEEWADYAASEKINDRGVAVDVEFALAASNFARAETEDLNARLLELTDDPKLTVTNHVRKARWLHTELWPSEELQAAVTKPPKENGKPRYTCDSSTRAFVTEALTGSYADMFDTEHREHILEFLELVEAGNSAASKKFGAIAYQGSYDGRVHGAYAFNGAGQTGRYSSRGVQLHNLIRSPVEKGNPDRAIDAMEDILDGATATDLQETYGYTVSRLLARLLRPTFIAPEGRMLVWSDWAQIEGRILPWLANSPGAEAKLDLYREGKDVYKHAAEPIFNRPADEIDDGDERQTGKVAELALGYGGSIGALLAMARNYGLTFSEPQAREIVDAWRLANPWARRFWDALWAAVIHAWQDPGRWYDAGRVRYMYHPHLMKGTLICQLPDQRLLVYPHFKHEKVRDEDGVWHWETTYLKKFQSSYVHGDLWYGILAENVTQATAASFLRMSLHELKNIVVLHTHDELVVEVAEHDVEATIETMERTMTYLPGWAEGLPLEVETEYGPFYTK